MGRCFVCLAMAGCQIRYGKGVSGSVCVEGDMTPQCAIKVNKQNSQIVIGNN